MDLVSVAEPSAFLKGRQEAKMVIYISGTVDSAFYCSIARYGCSCVVEHCLLTTVGR